MTPLTTSAADFHRSSPASPFGGLTHRVSTQPAWAGPAAAPPTAPAWIEPGWQAARWLPAGSAMAAEILHRDWSGTSLGAIEHWPACLRVAVCAVLDAPVPTVLLWGPELEQIYNDAYRPMLAHRHPQALGQPVQASSPADWPLHEPLFRRVLLAGEYLQFDEGEFALRSGMPDGPAYFASSCAPARDEAGTVRGVVLVARCAAPHGSGPRASDTAALGTDRLAQLFCHAPGFMAVFNGPDHVCEITNAAYETLIGQRALLGRPLRVAVPEFEAQGFLALMDDAYTTGLPFVATAMPVQILEAGGGATARRHLDFVYQPIKDAAGRVSGMFVQGHDVTEQALASAAWARSHQDTDDFLAMLYRR
jgi:PAS domain-containing protein